jgi:hypothetical protein
MKKKAYPVLMLTGGIKTDVDATFLVNTESPNLRNVFFTRGLVKKGLGFTTYGTLGSKTVMHMDTFPLQSGTTYELAFDTQYIYKRDPSTKEYTALNTTPYTGDEDALFSSVVTLSSAGASLFVYTNGVDRVQKWDGTNAPSALGGWTTSPTVPKTLANFQSRLIGGFITEAGVQCPFRVQWSIAGDPETITGTGSGFVDLAESADWVVALATLKSKLFVFKERSIWELAYVGGTTVFKPYLRVEGIGTYSPRSVVNLGDELIFLGTDNIYLFDGLEVTPIGQNVIPLLFETNTRLVNAAKANRVAATYVEELREYSFCCPTEGDVPNLLFTYNFDVKSWALRNLEVTAFGFGNIPTSNAWQDLSGIWNDQSWEWMERPLAASAPTTLIGNSSGVIKEDDRITTSTDYMCFETKDWKFAHSQRIVEFRVQAKGGPFTLFYSTDGGQTWSSESKTFAATSDWKEFVWYLNLTCSQIRFKVESTGSTLEIKWMEPWYIERARSEELQIT